MAFTLTTGPTSLEWTFCPSSSFHILAVFHASTRGFSKSEHFINKVGTELQISPRYLHVHGQRSAEPPLLAQFSPSKTNLDGTKKGHSSTAAVRAQAREADHNLQSRLLQQLRTKPDEATQRKKKLMEQDRLADDEERLQNQLTAKQKRGLKKQRIAERKTGAAASPSREEQIDNLSDVENKSASASDSNSTERCMIRHLKEYWEGLCDPHSILERGKSLETFLTTLRLEHKTWGARELLGGIIQFAKFLVTQNKLIEKDRSWYKVNQAYSSGRSISLKSFCHHLLKAIAIEEEDHGVPTKAVKEKIKERVKEENDAALEDIGWTEVKEGTRRHMLDLARREILRVVLNIYFSQDHDYEQIVNEIDPDYEKRQIERENYLPEGF
ncbi:hypothetical protein T439DRAFT_333941 [Meredithblackwellia eburnea MCA 4105]